MPLSSLSKTPVDGMYANYSDFVTLSNNDKYLEDKITAFSLAYNPDATTTYVYDESQDIQISCGKVNFTVPASTDFGSNMGENTSSTISLGSFIPIHVQLTVEGSAHVRACAVGTDGKSGSRPQAGGFRIKVFNTYSKPRTVTVHWLAFHVLPITSNNG